MTRPLVIGHRGAAGEAPENTLAAVRIALAAGVDGIEVDVRLSRDGVPVLLHDETLDRTTGAPGKVGDWDAAALRALDAGDGEGIPTLDDVLALVAGRAAVFCELKADPAAPAAAHLLAAATVETITRHGAASWAAIHSFDPQLIAFARAADPGISTAIISGAVAGPDAGGPLGLAVRLGSQAVSVEHRSVDAPFVAAARRRQLTVWAWTADGPDDWARLAGSGVGGIVTNRPSALRAYLEAAS